MTQTNITRSIQNFVHTIDLPPDLIEKVQNALSEHYPNVEHHVSVSDVSTIMFHVQYSEQVFAIGQLVGEIVTNAANADNSLLIKSMIKQAEQVMTEHLSAVLLTEFEKYIQEYEVASQKREGWNKPAHLRGAINAIRRVAMKMNITINSIFHNIRI